MTAEEFPANARKLPIDLYIFCFRITIWMETMHWNRNCTTDVCVCAWIGCEALSIASHHATYTYTHLHSQWDIPLRMKVSTLWFSFLCNCAVIAQRHQLQLLSTHERPQFHETFHSFSFCHSESQAQWLHSTSSIVCRYKCIQWRTAGFYYYYEWIVWNSGNFHRRCRCGGCCCFSCGLGVRELMCAVSHSYEIQA